MMMCQMIALVTVQMIVIVTSNHHFLDLNPFRVKQRNEMRKPAVDPCGVGGGGRSNETLSDIE